MTREEEMAAAWLRRAQFLDQEIAELTEAKLVAWEQATKVTNVLSGMPGSPSKDPHKLDRLVSLPGNFGELLEQRSLARQEVLKAIDGLKNSKYRTLLLARYINGKSWRQIARILDIEETSDSVYRNHNRALAEIYKNNSQIIKKYNSKS